MLTADTITDEQIRALRYDGGTRGEVMAELALGLRKRRGISRQVARARCAEILNARTVKP